MRRILLAFTFLAVFALWVQTPSFVTAQDEITIVGPIAADVVADKALELVGLFGMGAPGFAVAALAISLLMTLVKMGKQSSLFTKIPKRYRSWTPLLAGAVLGGMDGVARGEPITTSVIKGIAAGGGQQLAYEQLKGTMLGGLVETISTVVPRPINRA